MYVLLITGKLFHRWAIKGIAEGSVRGYPYFTKGFARRRAKQIARLNNVEYREV